MLSTLKSRVRKLHSEQKGIETLQAVGLTLVGIIVLVALFYVYAKMRNNVQEQGNTVMQFNYKSPSEVNAGANKGKLEMGE